MNVEICFPFFDTRFMREDADAGSRPAPRWMYGKPPPPLGTVGRLGRVDKWIPPLPYARCLAGDLITLGEGDPNSSVSLSLIRIDAIADLAGHARLSIWFDVQFDGEVDLAAMVEQVTRYVVSVHIPERRDQYEMLAAAGDSLADLYARESARTAVPPRGDYQADWVYAGRPFILMINTRRERVELGDKAIRLPLPETSFALSFLPWRSSEDDLAVPVWYLDAPRGGDAWRQPAEAVEEVNARYEELVTCLLLREEIAGAPSTNRNFAVLLDKYCQRLSGTLRRGQRHGVDLQAVLRLLSDYDLSDLNPRDSEKYTSALLERIGREAADRSLSRFGQINVTLLNGSLNMTTINASGTGNIINTGTMIANTISTTTNMIDKSQAPSDLKQKLTDLREPVVAASQRLPEAEGKALLRDYENFTEAALREDPPKEVVKAQGGQILKTLEKVAEYAKPAATIIGAILGIFGIL
jgi:hypothetical protein